MWQSVMLNSFDDFLKDYVIDEVACKHVILFPLRMFNIAYIRQLLLRRFKTLYFVQKINIISKFYCLELLIWYVFQRYLWLYDRTLPTYPFICHVTRSVCFCCCCFVFLINLELYKMVITDLLIRVQWLLILSMVR